MTTLLDFEDGTAGAPVPVADPVTIADGCTYTTDAHTGALACLVTATVSNDAALSAFVGSSQVRKVSGWFRVDDPPLTGFGFTLNIGFEGTFGYGVSVGFSYDHFGVAAIEPAYQDNAGDTGGEFLDFDYTPYLGAWLQLTLYADGSTTLTTTSGAVVVSHGPWLTPGTPNSAEARAFVGHGAVASDLVDDILFIGSAIVTRAYPRDDGLGIDGNSRIHPPPKSRRIVGGHL